jgi:hypothetical protein
MKLSSLPIAAFAISILLVSSSPVDARPVTTADLADKMICWESGNVQAFSADGKTANRQFQDGTWSIGDKGVRVNWPGGGADVDFEIQSDGTYTSERKDSGGTTHKGAGKICKGKPQKLADLAGKKTCWDFGTVETDFPGGKFNTSDNGEGIYYPNDEGLLSNFTQKWFKYDKIFKGVVQEDLDDGRVLYVGEWPGADYGVSVGETCK